MTSSRSNSVIVRHTDERILKGIYDDRIREKGEERLLVLVKGDVDRDEFKKMMAKRGVKGEVEVLLCG